MSGRTAVVSCLGHVLTFRGVFGPPRDLVTQATQRLCAAIGDLQPAQPVRFVLMTGVSVNDPRGPGQPPRTGAAGGACGAARMVPPARDSQRAADFLRVRVGAADPFAEWVVVRPDSLLEGDISQYTLADGIVSSLVRPAHTTMANIGHFIGELLTDPSIWEDWRAQMPLITDSA